MLFAHEEIFQEESKLIHIYITVCPGSSDPFYIASLLYKLGHYFLEILYVCWCSLNIGLRALVYVETTKLRIQLFIIYAEESSLGSLALSDSDDLYVRM